MYMVLRRYRLYHFVGLLITYNNTYMELIESVDMKTAVQTKNICK